MIIPERMMATPRDLKMVKEETNKIPTERAEASLNLLPREDPEAEEEALIHLHRLLPVQGPHPHPQTQEEEDPLEEIAQMKISCSTDMLSRSTIPRSRTVCQNLNCQNSN